MIVQITNGIVSGARLLSWEEVHSLAAYGDQAAINALIKGERIIDNHEPSKAYVEVDLHDGWTPRSEKYTGPIETMPKRGNYESDDLFIAALENWK